MGSAPAAEKQPKKRRARDLAPPPGELSAQPTEREKHVHTAAEEAMEEAAGTELGSPSGRAVGAAD